MLNRKINIYVVFFAIISIILTLPIKGHAVPAAPALHILSQPDGVKFEARQWGDEWLNGWETADGYSIVFDEDLGSWAYAINETGGNLGSSTRIVGADDPPVDIKHLRPVRQSLSVELAEGILGEGIQNVVPATGTANVPIILINFNNTATSYTTANFNTLLFGTGNYSMKDYYQEVSYGAFSVSAGPGGVVGWYTASNTHDYYGYINGFLRAAALAREAVVAADNAGFNFAPYDQDGDCYVDVVNIVHQGNGTEASGNVNDIWSHSWSLSSTYTTNDPCPAGGFIRVSDYVIQPETLYGGMQTMGVFAHEYGHALGLPDLYDTDGSSEGIGNWSLMAGGSWNQVTRPGDRPAHMDAWSKYYMGWVTPTQVAGTLTNEPIVQASASPDVYKLLTGTPASGEYFLVENRQKTSFDAGLPGPGLLIWHIDGATATNNYECYPGGPSCATGHYKVKLVQADNLWELEKNLNRGNTGDPYPGSTNNLSFTSVSSPNSNLYNGSLSNVSVTSISASGATMYATLSTSTSCTYSISPTSKSFTKSEGSGSVTVTTQTGCGWTAVSNASWITITSGSSGAGNGTVNYSVAANSGAARTGTMTIAGKTFTVSQSGSTEGGGCTYSISPTSRSFASGGGSASVTVTTQTGCGWTAVSNASWITITSGSSGAGNGTVNYSVAANSGAARTGTMTIAGKTFTVSQSGAASCTYSISPASRSFTSAGGAGSVSVTTQTGCGWTAVSNASWITITSGSSGTGSGTVSYSVSANSGASRTGTMTIAGRTFTVSQSGTGGGGDS